ncbi:DUF4397 domain-containing protein [Chitinophaga agrisoli]|nr:DUF4397 domain-containing protein [Chitinophaga agrisoli]
MRTKKYRFFWAAAALIAITGFSACLKDDNTQPQRQAANILFVNGLVGTDLDIYDGTQKLNQSAFSLTKLLLHQPYAGAYMFDFKKAGGDSLVGSTSAFQYDSLNYYTIVVYGQTPARVTALKDDFTDAKGDKINYRFFHMSPNTDAVDLYLNDTRIDSNVVFGGGFRNGFTALTSSLSNPKLVVKLAGTNTVIAENDDPAFTVGAGGVFTFLLTGLKGSSDDKVKLRIDDTVSYY